MPTILRRLVAFLVLVVALFAQSPIGEWSGAIEVPANEILITVRFEDKNGVLRGRIDIPAQGATDLALTGIDTNGRSVRFSIEDVGGDPTFAGELDEKGEVLTGTFTQGGQELTFRLVRKASGPAPIESFDGFQAWFDESRPMFSVPGCAVAVVKGGELLLTFVSGERDREGTKPVTADTLFAIGSSTKAFTTFLLATMVKDGAIEWDAPVQRWLPEFTLHDEPLSTRITPRDLVTHRSGMPRHDLVWYGATFDRADMVRRLRHLELSHDLREAWQYNNLMYLTAGHLAERVGGSSWEELVRSRVLARLGMARSNFTVAEMQRDEDHAEPYRKDDDNVAHIPFRDITAIGPAGSINSSVREMARWVALHVQRGQIDGERVLLPDAMRELHSPHMVMPARPRTSKDIVDVGYGLGWFVDVYRGHRRVHHGGNIDGFSAMVAFLPDAGYGFVVLTNLDTTPFAECVVRNLADRALALEIRDWRSEMLQRGAQQDGMEAAGKAGAEQERKKDTVPSHALADFAGDYAHDGYGACAIVLTDGVLHLDLHGIRAPLQHWHYDVFRCGHEAANPEIEGQKLQFMTDLEGEVDAVRIVLEPAVEPIRFSRAPDARLRDPQFLARFVGVYDLDSMTASISLEGDRLVAVLPGQRFHLEPQRGLVFALAGQPGYSVRFVEGADGAIVAARFRQPEGVFEAVRKKD
ncbi:MAG: serine hydrolase [Planctomycetota bacterium]